MRKTLLFSAMMMAAGIATAATPITSAIARQPIGDIKASKFAMPAPQKVTANLAAGEVVKTKTLKNGAKINLVKGADGMLHKVIQKPGQKFNPFSAKAKSVVKSYYDDTEGATLYEDFEAYDGESRGWIPTGWSQVSKTDPAHTNVEGEGTSLIWEGINESAYTYVGSGEAAEHIQVSVMDYETMTPAEAQDEWLIMPSVKVKAGDFLCFSLNYSPAFTLLNMETFDFTGENNILEVQVSTDGGSTWTKIWDVLPHAKSFTEDELWDDAMTFVRDSFYPMAINLGDYAGKDVKIAFRYVGIDGESMTIDDVLVGAPTPEAAVTAPSSVFPIGLTKDGYMLTDTEGNFVNYGLAPYKAALTWANDSELFDSSKWSYPDTDGESILTATTQDLDAPAYGYGTFAAPTLVTTLGTKTSEAASAYDVVRYGGAIHTSDGHSFDPSFYDASRIISEDAELSYASTVFGCGSDVDATWTRLMGATYTAKGIEYVVAKPEKPFVVSSAWIGVIPGAKFTDASKLTATIYKFDAETLEYVEMAKATCLPSTIEDDGENNPIAEFKFTQTQGELEVESPVMIDYDAIVAFDGEMAEGESFSFITSFDTDASKSSPVYVRLADEEGALTEIAMTALTFSDGSMSTGAFGAWDATYAWFETEDDSFEAKPEGDSKEFLIDSYYSVKDAEGDDAVEVEGEGLDEWYTVEFNEVDRDDDYANAMTVTVSALPEGVDLRSSYFVTNLYGMKKYFYVAQRSESSVGSLAASSTKAKVVGADIEVSSQKATNVAVYNLAGQKVAEKAFAGKATISGADMAKGVYVLKFNDNTVLKLAK